MSTGESSADVQREAEVERAELVNTLDQLRENLKPGNVIDEVLASANISTSDISNRVWQTARDNPFPATLIALGAAMLLGVGSRLRPASATRTVERTDADLGTGAMTSGVSTPDPGGANGGTEGRIKGKLQAVDAKAAASTSQIANSVRRLRREADRTAFAQSSTRPRRTNASGVHAMAYSNRSRDHLSGSLSRLLDEQPLVLAAVGVAIGAAIGAALPSTDTEGRLMGDASVSFKDRAQSMAQAELAHLKETASTTFDHIKQNVADRGLSKENLAGLVQDTGATVRDAVGDVTNHAADTAGLKS